VQAQARPDHDPFEHGLPADPAGIELLCTEKDAVKLWRTRPHAWAVPLVLTIESAFWEAIDRRLQPKLSFPDGPQTS
jgi:tetraacyldisaccharide 4'-kinase